MEEITKRILIISAYRLIIIISVLLFANFNGYGFLWLLLLLVTTFTISDKKESGIND